MKSNIHPAAFTAALPSLIGLAIMIGIGFSAERKRTEDLIQAYTESIANGLSAFFGEAMSIATAASTLRSSQELDIESALVDFRALVRANQHIYRISLADADGYVYDTLATGPIGNPWQGGRRTADNNDPNAEPVNLSRQPHFRELVTDNPSGKFYTLTDMSYVPQGLHPRAFVTTAPIIKEGKPIGVINVAQTPIELSQLYEDLTMDFLDKFGDKAHLILVSKTGQLLSNLKYSETYRAYMDELFGVAEIASISSLEDSFYKHANDVADAENHVISGVYHGEKHFIGGTVVEGTHFAVFLAVLESYMLRGSQQVAFVGIAAFAISMIMSVIWFILMPWMAGPRDKKPPKPPRRRQTRAKEAEDVFVSPVLPMDSRR